MISHDKGNFFAGIENVKGFFVSQIASVHEVEHPYRKCEHAVFLHVWPNKALVLGKYKTSGKPIMEHLLEAVGGRVIDFQEERPRFIVGQEDIS